MGHNSCEKPFSCVVLSLQAAASSRTYQPAPVWVLHGCRWISASLLSSVGYRETACITIVFITGCRGISAPAPGAPLPPPSSPISAPAGLFLSHFITPPPRHCCTAFFTLSLKCYHRGTISTSDGPSFGQWQVYLRTVCLMLGQLLIFSDRDNPCSPATSKTLLHKPNTLSLLILNILPPAAPECPRERASNNWDSFPTSSPCILHHQSVRN